MLTYKLITLIQILTLTFFGILPTTFAKNIPNQTLAHFSLNPKNCTPCTIYLKDNLSLPITITQEVAGHTGGSNWTGKIEGDPLTNVYLHREDNLTSGIVTYQNTTYQLRELRTDLFEVTTLEGKDTVPPENDTITLGQLQKNKLIDPIRKSEAPLTFPTDRMNGDDGTIIDLMVVYTPAARNYNPNIKSDIDVAITYLNQALYDSAINVRFRLAYAGEIAYDEAADSNTDLNNLANINGSLSEVWELRDIYGADMVSMWTYDRDVCGRGVLQSATPNVAATHNVVDVKDCNTAVSMAHELGHNLGGHHEVAQNPGPGAWSYSHGYAKYGDASTFGFYTIMAYGNDCLAQSPGGVCWRVNYFSNPNIINSGARDTIVAAIGDATTADNARTFTQLALATSQFRASKILDNQEITNDKLKFADCFIASAIYQTNHHPDLDILRTFRNKVLLPYTLGKKFVSFYYHYSPPLARTIYQNDLARIILFIPLQIIIILIKFPALFFVAPIIFLLFHFRPRIKTLD